MHERWPPDASGPVSITGPLTDHFIPNQPRKGSAFTTTPSPNSTVVYQDELASFTAQILGAGRIPHLALDNEPDLWHFTHVEVRRSPAMYGGRFHGRGDPTRSAAVRWCAR
jgi:hypothetical protein